MIVQLTKFYLISLIFFGLYKISFSRGTTNFSIRRIALLSILPLTILLRGLSGYLNDWSSSLFGKEALQLPQIILDPIAFQPGVESSYSLKNIFFIVWALGAMFFGARMIWRITHLFRLIRSIDNWTEVDGNRVAYSNRKEAFSFWKWVHIPEIYKEDKSVLIHEIAHNKKKHSLDIILLEIQRVLFWFNPVVFLILRETKLLHEYEIDQIVQEKVGRSNYINSLLNAHFGTSSIQFIQSFNNKKTLKMRINNLKQSERKATKLRWLTPIIGVFLAVSLSSFVITENTQEPEKKIQTTDPVYTEVDKQPEFKGGKEAMFAYMGTSIVYPESAMKNKAEGTVFVNFVVTKTGAVKDVKIAKGAEQSLDAEAMRVVNEMPDWIPGEKDGKKVDVQMTLPIAFKL